MKPSNLSPDENKQENITSIDLKEHASYIQALSLLPDGRLASGSWDKTIKIWDTKSGRCLNTLEGHSGNITALATLPDGRLASGSHDKTIKLWNTKSGLCLNTFEGHSHWLTALALLPDGRLVSGSWDNTIKIWDTTSDGCLNTLQGHSFPVLALAPLPDGRLASGSYGKAIKLWDTESGGCLNTLEGHSDNITALATLPDGRLVSGSQDNTIKLWDTTSGRCLNTLQGHSEVVSAFALLPDGRLVSGSWDKTIKLWDIASERCLNTLQGHSDCVFAFALLLDGRLASGSRDYTIKLWDIPALQLKAMPKGVLPSAQPSDPLPPVPNRENEEKIKPETNPPRPLVPLIIKQALQLINSLRDFSLSEEEHEYINDLHSHINAIKQKPLTAQERQELESHKHELECLLKNKKTPSTLSSPHGSLSLQSSQTTLSALRSSPTAPDEGSSDSSDPILFAGLDELERKREESEQDDNGSLISERSSVFNNTDPKAIAPKLCRQIVRQGEFTTAMKPGKYLSISWELEEVEALKTEVLKATLQELFLPTDITLKENEIRLSWKGLNPTQVRNFEKIFYKHKDKLSSSVPQEVVTQHFSELSLQITHTNRKLDKIDEHVAEVKVVAVEGHSDLAMLLAPTLQSVPQQSFSQHSQQRQASSPSFSPIIPVEAKTDAPIANSAQPSPSVPPLPTYSPRLFVPSAPPEEKKPELSREALKLLQHVIRGEQEQAEALLKQDPKLLLESGVVEDYSFGLDAKNHRKVEGTALQIALGAEDVEMYEMIVPYFNKIPDGESEKLKQINAQFPDGYEEQEKIRNQRDLVALNKVLQAIANAKKEDNCEAALSEFRNYLEPKGIIKTGKHFNAQLLLRAFELYEENYERFGNVYNSPKNVLCWRKVIGYIQRFLPSCYAQAFAQGISEIVQEGQKSNRSFKFRYDNASMFPLDSDLSSRLGFDFAGASGRPMPTCSPRSILTDSLCRFYKTYVEQKQQHCKILCNVQTIKRRIGV